MKNLYHSTRNQKKYIRDYEAILQGIADDAGLYVFDELEACQIDMQAMLDKSYQEIAFTVMQKLLPSFSDNELHSCLQHAYSGTFTTDEVTPLRKVGNDFFLELFHGPTSAFKDVGLQMLPQLMSQALAKKGNQRVMILTATSGDTGKAALEGFKDVANTGIIVFYPADGVSDMQSIQMCTQAGKNVAVCALDGNFDDAQSQVKVMFSSNALSSAFAKDDIYFSSANSINIGRLIPQVVYYFYAYVQMVKQQAIKVGDDINFCVPTGNFGNVLAGYYAKLMGLPVHRFLVASNANNVLYDFLQTGIYDRNRVFHKTISPSMDILISSNLERLLYYMSGSDCTLTDSYMKQLQDDGRYEISQALKEKIQALFYGGYSTDAQTKKMIKEVFQKFGYVMDPHTAVGYKVMKEYQKTDEVPCVLLSTASPYKFSKEVYHAIFDSYPKEDEFAVMERLSKQTKTQIPENLLKLKGKPLRFQECVKKNEMQQYIVRKTKEIFYD